MLRSLEVLQLYDREFQVERVLLLNTNTYIIRFTFVSRLILKLNSVIKVMDDPWSVIVVVKKFIWPTFSQIIFKESHITVRRLNRKMHDN